MPRITQTRQIGRLRKCIDELIKIHDDGKGSEYTRRLLDLIREEISRREARHA